MSTTRIFRRSPAGPAAPDLRGALPLRCIFSRLPLLLILGTMPSSSAESARGVGDQLLKGPPLFAGCCCLLSQLAVSELIVPSPSGLALLEQCMAPAGPAKPTAANDSVAKLSPPSPSVPSDTGWSRLLACCTSRGVPRCRSTGPLGLGLPGHAPLLQ